MDPIFEVYSLFRRRTNYDECIEKCTVILIQDNRNETVIYLKLRALTQRVYYCDDWDVEVDKDFFKDTLTITARPQTIFTSRPISSVQTRFNSSRQLRLTTAKILVTAATTTAAAVPTFNTNPFLQISRLNLDNYGQNSRISKALFEFLYHHEGAVRPALQLALQVPNHQNQTDWWWHLQIARCYNILKLHRDAQLQLTIALKLQPYTESFLKMSKLFIHLDQPLSALEMCKNGLIIFKNDVELMLEIGRLLDDLNNPQESLKMYKLVLNEQATNTEAIASLALYYFYHDQPEIALYYYRRLLATGLYSAELFNNLGVSSLYGQQYDSIVSYFENALNLSTDSELKAEIWYNLSHLGILCGDLELAVNCLVLSTTLESKHARALNNLGVLHYKCGKLSLGVTYLTAANRQEPTLQEVLKNLHICNM